MPRRQSTTNLVQFSGTLSPVLGKRRDAIHFDRRADHDRRHHHGIDDQPADGPANSAPTFHRPILRAAARSRTRKGAQTFAATAAACGRPTPPSAGRTNQPRREQRRDARHGDRDRIQKAVGRPRRHSDAGDDERELADLRQAHAGLHRGLNALAGEKRAERDRKRFCRRRRRPERRARPANGQRYRPGRSSCRPTRRRSPRRYRAPAAPGARPSSRRPIRQRGCRQETRPARPSSRTPPPDSAKPNASPTLATTVVSGRSSRTTARINRGTVSKPTTSTTPRTPPAARPRGPLRAPSVPRPRRGPSES